MKKGHGSVEAPGADQGYQTIATRSGVRLVQHGTVLSEVLTHPGPTHSVADVIAACVQAVAPGPRVAMLGFAGGGVLAPLRAMGGRQTVAAVDLENSGWRLFRRLCSAWAGQVDFKRVEACAWLRGNPSRHDVIIDDLSVPMNADVFKPAVTWKELPRLIYKRLSPDGVALFNLLPPADVSWDLGIHRVLQGAKDARLIYFTDYENRLLIVGKQLPAARELSRRVRANLRSIRSRLASRISVRHCDDAILTGAGCRAILNTLAKGPRSH